MKTGVKRRDKCHSSAFAKDIHKSLRVLTKGNTGTDKLLKEVSQEIF